MPRGLGADLVRSCRAVLRVLGVSPCPSSVSPARAIEREDVCVSGGTSPTVAGVEARESSDPCSESGGASVEFVLRTSSAGAVSLGEEWSRPKLGRRPRVGVVSSRFFPELADTQPHSRPAPAGRGARALVETWLILPVVICLSQRLSHACLSISFYMAKLRMAH